MLRHNATASCWISDARAADAMRRLAAGAPSIAAGESAVAGLAGLLAGSMTDAGREMLELMPESRVFILGSEGPTDPDGYAQVLAS
jgi:diaminopropionate ammonia-lyase